MNVTSKACSWGREEGAFEARRIFPTTTFLMGDNGRQDLVCEAFGEEVRQINNNQIIGINYFSLAKSFLKEMKDDIIRLPTKLVTGHPKLP